MPKIYLPDVENEERLDVVQELLFRIVRDSPHQRRQQGCMQRHPSLDQAAQYKAQEMARLGYFGHTSPAGVSANQNVRKVGYPLPDWYPFGGNNVESLYIGTDRPQDAADAWFASDHHRPHVYGQDAFFAGQCCVGVGYAPFPQEEHRGYFVFISAPCL